MASLTDRTSPLLSRLIRVGNKDFHADKRYSCVLKTWIPGFVVFLCICSAAFAAEPRRLLIVGDSLASGYGLPHRDSFQMRLQSALLDLGVDVTILDGAVSGDTTTGGLARIDWMLADKPTHAVVELGANDALRAVPPETTRDNLDRMLSALKRAGVKILLAGMYAPPNLGRSYEEEFDSLYPELAQKHGIELYPFFLDGVAAVPALNQPDGIHPNAKGVSVIVERILPYVLRLLRE